MIIMIMVHNCNGNIEEVKEREREVFLWCACIKIKVSPLVVCCFDNTFCIPGGAMPVL